ncbi:MAG: outer membrane protein transport protein [Gammaproteobacteria bacterium]|nr:MAG: outer membrane protein transport protein [Gammaproteobacteria bacterium]
MSRYTTLTAALRRAATSSVVLLWSTVAFGQAGGIAFPAPGGPTSGTSQAGQAAVARDASTAWLNPAGLTRLDKFQLLLDAQIVNLDVEFNPDPATTTTGSDGGNAGDTLPAGSFYLALPISERVTFGASLTAPYGLPLEYKSDWAGRSFVTEIDLLVINIEPSLGIKVSDWVSVGIGLDFQFADLEQKLIVPVGATEIEAKITGDNWAVGASLGLLIEPSETTRFGLRYRSQVDHDLEGDLTTIGTLQTSASLTTPQSLTFSAYHELNERWTLLADAGWTDWSAFDRTVINISAIPIEADIPRNWKDTWNVGLGAHYRLTQNWLLMTGVSYVSSSVDDADRTPDIPVDEQWRFAIGVENEMSGSFRWGATFSFVDLGDDKTDATNFAGRLVGDYDSTMQTISVYGSWTF